MSEPVAASNRALSVLERIRAAAKRHPVAKLVWQIGVAVVGVALVGAGAAMLVLPGPGWLVIAAGLVVLSSEFVWFERPLKPVRHALNKVAGDTAPRGRKIVLAVAAVGSVAGGLIWYL